MDGILMGVMPLAAGAIVLALGTASLVRNPGLRVSRTFFASMFFAGAFNIALFALLALSDPSSAKVLMFMAVLAAGANIFLASSLSTWKGESWTRDHPVVVLLAVLAMASAAGVLGSAAAAPGALASPVGTWWFPVLLGAALAGASVWAVYSARRTSTDQYFRRATTWLGAAFMLPAISLSAVFGGGGGIASTLVVSFAPLLSAMVFVYVAVRYRTFTQVPAAAKDSARALLDSMSPGSSILVEGKSTDAAFSMFMSEIGRGGDGLVISRKHPGQVREVVGLESASVLWLCSQPGPGRIDPASLSLLQSTMSDFLRRGKRSVVLLDGLEYLVSENRPDKILRLVYSVKDVVTMSGSKLIVPLDPETLGSKDLAFFEREFKVLRPEPGQAG